MAVDPDDEALSWGDESDPSHAAAPSADAVEADGTASGSLALVAYGIFAGLYLLYTIGWVLASIRNPIPVGGILPVILYQFGEFLAIVSPALWAGSVAVFTRHKRPATRVVWLLIGALVLIPWPFIA
ncbi:hypothetical protein [Cryobacterium sp. BB736]|uniref:hypothetical protein n=1 Tax=Cryobacterium sp. BB736 TaxID=2746963 RepID=UPI001875C5A0|nr:hypothetical protein [Cryobacterium sp. BB736]